MPESLDLAARCIADERLAQRELYHAHRRRAHRALYRILGTNAPMDDLLQDVFVNVFRSLPTYRGEAPLGAWVDRIAVRVAYAYVSQRAPRHAELELASTTATDAPSAERAFSARETLARLYALLERMEPKLQIAFTLHVLDDRPLSEVASLMDASLVATKARVWRARRALLARAQRDPALVDFVRGRIEPEDEQAPVEGRTA